MPTGISVIMGTRNEAESIEDVVKKYVSVLSQLSDNAELIIADYSTDDTLARALRTAHGSTVKLIPLSVDRPGRGYALRLGVEHASHDLICLADGDGSHDPHYLPKMLRKYRPGCIVMASRFPPLGWSDEHTFSHYYGNRITVAAVNLLFRGKVTDVTNGFGIMSRDTWTRLDLSSGHWSFDVQIICRALKKSISIIEIPSFEPRRSGGKAKLNLFDAFWRIGGRILLERLTC